MDTVELPDMLLLMAQPSFFSLSDLQSVRNDLSSNHPGPWASSCMIIFSNFRNTVLSSFLYKRGSQIA